MNSHITQDIGTLNAAPVNTFRNQLSIQSESQNDSIPASQFNSTSATPELSKCGFISESDVENEDLKSKCLNSKQKEDPKNSKKFTSKILSFIKKLRNENNTDGSGQTGDEEDAEEYEEEYDYEFDSIDQVSDYDNSGSDNDSNVDLYSIVSIPKPKLEPFFKNNSDPDLRSLISNNLSLIKSKNVEGEGEQCDTVAAHVSFNSTTPLNKKQLKKNRSSSLTSSFNTAVRKSSEPSVVGNLSTTEKKPNPNSETCSFFLIENSTLRSIVEANCKKDKSYFFIDFQSDMKSLLELILKLDLTDTNLELVVIGTDQSFNSFLKFYAQFFNSDKVLNIFYIPFECTSPLAKLIAKFSLVFCNYFTDHFWTSLSNCNLADKSFQIISRISKYLELGRQQNKKLTFQIGELTIDCAGEAVKSMPFISEVKIELCKGEEPTKSVPWIDRKSSLTYSNSLPQFFNTVSTSSSTLLINAANPSIDSTSFMSSLEVPETDFHLELDYWRIERISGHSMIQANENYTSDEYSAIKKELKIEAVNSSKNKIKKRSLSGNFQYITIYRKPKNQMSKTNKNFDKFFQKELKNFQSTINCARGIGNNLAVQKSVEGEFLSIDYGLKEKKQKIKLSTKKLVCQKANHKVINKISNVNLKQLDTNKLKIKVDGIEIENVKSLQVSSSFDTKCLHLNLIVS